MNKLPSPQDLKHKIIVKAKKSKRTEREYESESSTDEDQVTNTQMQSNKIKVIAWYCQLGSVIPSQ